MRRVAVTGHEIQASQVQEAVAAIRGGRIVVLPTETVYGLAADPTSAASIESIRSWKGRPADLRFTHHLADSDQLERFAAAPTWRVNALVARYWPGPLTLVLPARETGTVGVRVPAHPFARAVARELGGSLFLTSVNPSGQDPWSGPDEIAAAAGDRIDLLFDAGPPPLRQASTVARLLPLTRDGWPEDTALEFGELEVIRAGLLTADEIATTASHTWLFVCTGNICRSPMAESLARRTAARRLGTQDDRVLAHGLRFASAGITALPGMPASDGAVAATRDLGIDLEGHRSRALSREVLRSAHRIFCLGPSHLVAVRALEPSVAARAELLDPRGAGVPDPYGADVATYRQTRDVILHAVESRLDEILPR